MPCTSPPHLPFDDHRVDDLAEVIDRAEAFDLVDAGVRIDLDFAHIRARREREVRRIVERLLVQTGLELVVRIVVRHVGGERHFAEHLLLIRACDRIHALVVHHVGFGRFHQVRGDLLALGDHLVQGLDDGGAAHGDRTRAVGAHAKEDLGRVPVHDVDVLDRHPQAVGDHLRESRLVPLAVCLFKHSL